MKNYVNARIDKVKNHVNKISYFIFLHLKNLSKTIQKTLINCRSDK